jgi:hypothetical protein
MNRPTVTGAARPSQVGPGLSAEQRDEVIRILMAQIRESVAILRALRESQAARGWEEADPPCPIGAAKPGHSDL